MLQLLGEYNCKIDAKGRLRLPAPLLKQLGEQAEQGFVVNRGFEQCMVLYPRQAWEAHASKIQQLNQYVKSNRAFVRYFFRGATEVELDGNTRMLLPKMLLEHATIDKELVLLAYFDKIEIWSKERYEAMLEEEPEDFEALAEMVMGNLTGGAVTTTAPTSTLKDTHQDGGTELS